MKNEVNVSVWFSARSVWMAKARRASVAFSRDEYVRQARASNRNLVAALRAIRADIR